jgi:hypothetical protein
MESRTERYRAKSLECLHAAHKATDAQAKASFLELVELWRDLADQVEPLEREGPKP